MGLEEVRVVRTRVVRDVSSGVFVFGSGYIISPGVVLTAAHVLEPARGVPPEVGHPCEVLTWGVDVGDWQLATVAWVDHDRDVAAVSCPTLPVTETVRWGRLVGSAPVEWTAVGYPVASLDAVGRQPEQSGGRVWPVSELPTGRLALTVESRPARQTDLGGSGWAGLSGAAVFCSERLVGVVMTDPDRYADSLVARRVATVADSAELAVLLGAAPQVDPVRGDTRESGLGLVTEAASRTRARLPNAPKGHQLDLVFGGPVEPYLMTGHMWLQGTNVSVEGRWFRVGVLNKSSAAIAGVSVQLVSVDPSGVVHTVPLRLHLMHDNPPPGQPNVETFTVEPGEEPHQFVDVVSMYRGQPGIQIEHIVPAVLKIYNAGQYTFMLRVSAPDSRSRTRAFSVGLDDGGGLTFAQLS